LLVASIELVTAAIREKREKREKLLLRCLLI